MYCENCKKPDCGKCGYCLDKKKFGGKNIKRKPCVQRTCLNEQKVRKPRIDIPAMSNMDLASAGSEDLNSKLKALFDDPDDEAYWKEFCEAEDVHDGQREIKNAATADILIAQYLTFLYSTSLSPALSS